MEKFWLDDVLSNDVKLIVCLVAYEHYMFKEYWPTRVCQKMQVSDDIFITLMSKSKLGRKLTSYELEVKDQRVTLLHFEGWPESDDHVPRDLLDIADCKVMIREIMAFILNDATGLPLIYCGSGKGRTGTLLLILARLLQLRGVEVE